MDYNRPHILYHGTRTAIHTLEKPYLGPQKTPKGADEGDPQEPHVFATPDRLMAEIFSLKTSNCIAISPNSNGNNFIIFDDSVPINIHESGWVYELSPDGFSPTVARGETTRKWAKLGSDMPVVGIDGNGIPLQGIPLKGVPRTEIAGIGQVIRNHNVQVYVLNESISAGEFSRQNRDALHAGGQEALYQSLVDNGDMSNVTTELMLQAMAPSSTVGDGLPSKIQGILKKSPSQTIKSAANRAAIGDQKQGRSDL